MSHTGLDKFHVSVTVIFLMQNCFIMSMSLSLYCVCWSVLCQLMAVKVIVCRVSKIRFTHHIILQTHTTYMDLCHNNVTIVQSVSRLLYRFSC